MMAAIDRVDGNDGTQRHRTRLGLFATFSDDLSEELADRSRRQDPGYRRRRRLRGSPIDRSSSGARAESLYTRQAGRGHADDMTTRLIVGFDGSDHSRTASSGLWRSGSPGCRGRVITASVRPVMSYDGTGSSVYSPGAYDDTAEQARFHTVDTVAKAVAEHPTVGIDIEVVDASPSNALLHPATADDLIVVGSSGAGVVKAFLLGSVVASVLHEGRCPVVVTPWRLSHVPAGSPSASTGRLHPIRALAWAVSEAELWSADLSRCPRLGVSISSHGRQCESTKRCHTRRCRHRPRSAIEATRELTTLPVERRLLDGGTTSAPARPQRRVRHDRPRDTWPRWLHVDGARFGDDHRRRSRPLPCGRHSPKLTALLRQPRRPPMAGTSGRSTSLPRSPAVSRFASHHDLLRRCSSWREEPRPAGRRRDTSP